MNNNANTLGHAALLYFIGEAIQEERCNANALGRETLLYFIGEAIDSRNHVA